ncbi:MAG: adenosine deaminase [Halomonas sp.]|uniref:adenosine deaminase n=1 Tax=Halomonas sp. TaxID=1486246 RepID=UPI003F8EDAA0
MYNQLLRLPKAELHLHIEGTLTPERMMSLAERNGMPLRYTSVDDIYAAYEFTDLQSFLDVYFQGMQVLKTAQDFEDLAMDYFELAHSEGVVHIELHVDPQAHLARGIALETVIEGLNRARSRAQRELDLSSAMILAFLRDRPAEEAAELLESTIPYLEHFAAVGLDSAELGHPPSKFRQVFARAAELGLARVAHAGEEGPPAYIYEALDILDVERIDHGVRCMEDPALVERLRDERRVLTVCPLSNVRLKVVERMEDHPLPAMLDAGLMLTLNSDDPSYFGGGLLDNYLACHQAFGWDMVVFKKLARNALNAAFMSEARREALLARMDALSV